MPIDKLQALRARISSFKTTIESASPKEREQPVDMAIAENWNKLMEDLGMAFPELKEHLPRPIKRHGDSMLAQFGGAEIHYLGLAIYAEQVLTLLNQVHHE